MALNAVGTSVCRYGNSVIHSFLSKRSLHLQTRFHWREVSAVLGTRAFALQRFEMRASAIALVLIKAKLRMGFGEVTHESVAVCFGEN